MSELDVREREQSETVTEREAYDTMRLGCGTVLQCMCMCVLHKVGGDNSNASAKRGQDRGGGS